MFGWLRQRRSVDASVAMAIVEAQRECLLSDNSGVIDGIRRIDPQNATENELEAAVETCLFYWSFVYPERENDLVEWVHERCSAELDRRRKALGADW